MRCRIYEAIGHIPVLAPTAVPQNKPTATAFVDMGQHREVSFVVTTGELAAKKKVTLELVGADNVEGTLHAEKIADHVQTMAETGSFLGIVSYRPRPDQKRYVGVKIKHDGDGPVNVSVICEADGNVSPAPVGSACLLVL